MLFQHQSTKYRNEVQLKEGRKRALQSVTIPNGIGVLELVEHSRDHEPRP